MTMEWALQQIENRRKKYQEYLERIDEVKYFIVNKTHKPKKGGWEYTEEDWEEIPKKEAYNILEDLTDNPGTLIIHLLMEGIEGRDDRVSFTWPFKGRLRAVLANF